MKKILIVIIGVVVSIIWAHAQTVTLTNSDMDVLGNGVIQAQKQEALDESAIASDQGDINAKLADEANQNAIIQHGAQVYNEWIASQQPVINNSQPATNMDVQGTVTDPQGTIGPIAEDLQEHQTCKTQYDGEIICEGHIYGPVGIG